MAPAVHQGEIAVASDRGRGPSGSPGYISQAWCVCAPACVPHINYYSVGTRMDAPCAAKMSAEETWCQCNEPKAHHRPRNLAHSYEDRQKGIEPGEAVNSGCRCTPRREPRRDRCHACPQPRAATTGDRHSHKRPQMRPGGGSLNREACSGQRCVPRALISPPHGGHGRKRSHKATQRAPQRAPQSPGRD